MESLPADIARIIATIGMANSPIDTPSDEETLSDDEVVPQYHGLSSLAFVSKCLARALLPLTRSECFSIASAKFAASPRCVITWRESEPYKRIKIIRVDADLLGWSVTTSSEIIYGKIGSPLVIRVRDKSSTCRWMYRAGSITISASVVGREIGGVVRAGGLLARTRDFTADVDQAPVSMSAWIVKNYDRIIYDASMTRLCANLASSGHVNTFSQSVPCSLNAIIAPQYECAGSLAIESRKLLD